MKKSFMFVTLLSLSCSSLTLAAPQWPLDDAESVAVFQSLPVVPYQDSFLGGDYLDGVTPSDFPVDMAAFVFTDPYRRTGIALRYIIEKTAESSSSCYQRGKPGQIYASTIFQRFTNGKDWTIGEHYGAGILLDSVLFSPHTKVSDRFSEVKSKCVPEDGEMELFSASSLIELIEKGSVPLVRAYTSLHNICPVSCGIIRLVPNEGSFWSRLWSNVWFKPEL